MKSLVVISSLFICSLVSAQTTLDLATFATTPADNYAPNLFASWSGQVSSSSGILTVGGTADDSGSLSFVDILPSVPFDSTGFVALGVRARLDLGNLSNGFIINLFDDQGLGVVTATFSAANFNQSTFTTVYTAFSNHPEGGSKTNIAYYGIAGAGTTSAFKFSFDNISISTSATGPATAVPEPSTYAAIAGALALGFVAYRRRAARTV